MEETLQKINDIIESYESGAWVSVDNLRVMMRELSACHYHLTKINVEAHQNWNAIIHNRETKESVASATVKADNEFPELRMTRKILESIDNVIWSMRSELSIIKKD